MSPAPAAALSAILLTSGGAALAEDEPSPSTETSLAEPSGETQAESDDSLGIVLVIVGGIVCTAASAALVVQATSSDEPGASDVMAGALAGGAVLSGVGVALWLGGGDGPSSDAYGETTSQPAPRELQAGGVRLSLPF